MQERDEKCTCYHGGEDFEDHLPGEGCARRGCSCFFWLIDEDEESEIMNESVFAPTVTKVEVTKWYAVQGAPAIASGKFQLSPVAAQFHFTDGQLDQVTVTGAILKLDGSVGERTMTVLGIYPGNKKEWPTWLWEAFQDASVSIHAPKPVAV